MPGDIADCLLLDCAEAENSALLDYLACDVPWQITTLCLNKQTDLAVRITQALQCGCFQYIEASIYKVPVAVIRNMQLPLAVKL